MFVNVVEFPPVADGRDADFRAWFDWSTSVYADNEQGVGHAPTLRLT